MAGRYLLDRHGCNPGRCANPENRIAAAGLKLMVQQVPGNDAILRRRF
jgi:hypothetical protein